MRKSKFIEHQLLAIVKAVETGRAVKDVCREREISEATYYQWKSKYGLEAANIRRLPELKAEYCCLKVYGDLVREWCTEDVNAPVISQPTTRSVF